MKLKHRIELLVKLGQYMKQDDAEWKSVQNRAYQENNWFIPEFIELAINNICSRYLDEKMLEDLARQYNIPEENNRPQKIGIVMAGNIPMVGFHDLLAVFITGHFAFVKLSSKDDVLIRHLVEKMQVWEPETSDYFHLQPMLKNCDAYIATGSNTTSAYFEYYFRKYPHIIRGNKTSVAVLSGNESQEELQQLADDVFQFFGLGCRNVTKLFVPVNYNFVPLLQALKKYEHLSGHNKYRNNYDYNLAIHLLNNKYYMSNGTILLVEDAAPFSPISQLNYEYYNNSDEVKQSLQKEKSIQCVAGSDYLPFGTAQKPGLCDFADGVDSIQFLLNL